MRWLFTGSDRQRRRRIDTPRETRLVVEIAEQRSGTIRCPRAACTSDCAVTIEWGVDAG